MLYTGHSAVGYWELPPSGVRLNGAKVEQDDGQLIRSACNGDTAAYGALVRKYQVRLCTSLTHVCGSIDEAERFSNERIRRYQRAAALQPRGSRIREASAMSASAEVWKG